MRLLLFCGLFISQNIIFCQNCELYLNSDNEMIGLCGDSIVYRLINEGGLITYTLGVGSFKIRSNKIKINTVYHSFASLNTRTYTDKNEGAVIMLKDNNSTPMAYANIQINFDGGKKVFSADSLGLFEVPESLINKMLLLQVRSMGSSFEYEIELEKDVLYVITSLVPQKYSISNISTLARKCMVMRTLSNDIVEMYDRVTKSWKEFQKQREEISFFDIKRLLLE